MLEIAKKFNALLIEKINVAGNRDNVIYINSRRCHDSDGYFRKLADTAGVQMAF